MSHSDVAGDARPRTHLERAFRVFVKMRPQTLTARALAMLMGVEVSCAYNYIARLKRAGCICIAGGDGRFPEYAVVDLASTPPPDRRGRRRSRADGRALSTRPALALDQWKGLGHGRR